MIQSVSNDTQAAFCPPPKAPSARVESPPEALADHLDEKGRILPHSPLATWKLPPFKMRSCNPSFILCGKQLTLKEVLTYYLRANPGSSVRLVGSGVRFSAEWIVKAAGPLPLPDSCRNELHAPFG